ncbi:MAG: DUF4435 domain-containing protein [Methylovulum sp.]|nr:DUF4435 domain-containing protein [Methylovulum sp.]
MQQYLNEIDTIGEIRQARRHPAGKNYLWVLVEGETDQRLYAKLINGNNTKVEMVHGGVESLRFALSILIAETNQVIGIRDADFLHLNQQQETINHLFLTDVHDAEMMLLACDTVFAAVVAEYLPSRRSDFSSFRDTLLASLIFLAGLRWVNDTECLELNFKASLTHFYDANGLAITDKNQCIGQIAQCSPNKKRIPQVHEVENKIAGVSAYYQLCQGHDVEMAFALHANTVKPKNVKDTDIGKALRVTYRLEDFATTRLYRQLKDWETQTGYLLFDARSQAAT